MTDAGTPREDGASAHATEAAGAAWLALWYEPWRQMHPAWLDEVTTSGRVPADQAQWLDRFRSPGPALRLAYRWFCAHFDIDAERPLPLHRLELLPAHLPLDGPALDRAALALGRVAYASRCLAGTHRDLAELFSPQRGDVPMWRDALRQAKARPLRTDGAQPPPSAADIDLRRWALPLMARLIDEALPGAWNRLRLRCDPALMQHGLPPPRLSDSAAGLRRQVWRVWRNAAVAPLDLTAPP